MPLTGARPLQRLRLSAYIMKMGFVHSYLCTKIVLRCINSLSCDLGHASLHKKIQVIDS